MAKKIILKNYLLTLLFVAVSLAVFRPFLCYQLKLRASDYLSASLYKDAVRMYEKAVFFDPGDIEALNWLAFSYRNLGDLQRTVDIYKKALEIDPDNIVACFDLGMIYHKAKDHKMAREYFLRASSMPRSKNIKEFDYHFCINGAKTMLKITNELEKR